MRLALVHEWLTTYAGSERVVEQMLRVYPAADLFAVANFLPENERGFLQNKDVRTTFVQRLPLARSKFRHYLPLMPLAIEQFDMTGYDVVLSSNHAVAKGVITGPDQFHLCYVHSPARYAWDLTHQYLREAGLDRGLKGWLARLMFHRLRAWDQAAANRVDVFVANSRYIARRIRKCYRRKARVIYPPVDVDAFELATRKEDYYFTASRMVPYKKMDLIVEAFSRTPQRRLVVVGDGPEMEKIRAKAGSNVELLGYQPFAVLREHMQRAKAFVFAAEEDFGITPVEAQACGTPVIAFGRGGATETVVDGETGLFFDEQTCESLLAAVDRFESAPEPFDPYRCRAHAEGFSPERFRQELEALVDRCWNHFARAKRPRQYVGSQKCTVPSRVLGLEGVTISDSN